MKLDLNCTCGAQWKGEVPNQKAAAIMGIWTVEHGCAGHSPCDSKTASRNRRYAEEKAAKEQRKADRGF